MASGSFNLTRTGETSRYISFVCNWSATSDTGTNSSVVTVNVVATKSSSSTASTYGNQTTTASVEGNSQSTSGSFRLNAGSSITLLTKTYAVYHNADGSKQTTISVNIGGNVMWGNGSQTVTLDKINRKSKIEGLGNFTVENEHWLTYIKYNNSFWQNLYIQVKKAGTSDSNYETIYVEGGYQSGEHIQFSSEVIKRIYEIASPDIQTGSYVDVVYHLETYTSQQNGEFLGEDSRKVKGYITKAKAEIDVLGDFGIEGEHWLTYKKYSNNFYYNLWITARKRGSNNSYETVGAYGDYKSGQHIRFTDETITKLYKIALPETNVWEYLEVRYHLETWTQKGGEYIGESAKEVKGYIDGTSMVNVNGTWKKSVPFIKVNGNWKPCVAYVNVRNTWKKGFV